MIHNSYLCGMIKKRISMALFLLTCFCVVSLVSNSAIPVSQKSSVYKLRNGRLVQEYLSPGDSLRSRKALKGDVIGYPTQMHLCNNISRENIGVDLIIPGQKHAPDILPYTGKGVVIGIMDCGIDPNHITFLDSEGKSRVKTYIFTESAEESKDKKLQAQIFATPAEILTAPIDSSEGGHGTHTTASAAGSWKENPYSGMAPDAELFLVGMGALVYDDEIIYGMRAASDYALANNKRAVLSLSLGSGSGPHDGTSPVGLVSKEIREKGNLICFSAGNDGKRFSTIFRNFSNDTTPVRSIFCKWDGGKTHYCPLEAWSKDTKQTELQLYVMQKDTLIYKSRWITPQEVINAGGRVTLFSKGSEGELLPEMKNFIEGEIYCEMGIYEPNGRFRIILDADVAKYLTPGFPPQLGFGIRSPQGADTRIYANPYYNCLGSWENPDFMYGTSDETISDLAASPDVVSVGMLNAVESRKAMSGQVYSLANQSFGELGKPNLHTSRGTTWEGEKLPMILAPGTFVISALYPEAPGMEQYYVCDTMVNGKRYVWGIDTGTSMSSPTAAGVMALWLEALPNLTFANMKDIFEHTSNPSALEGYEKYAAYGTIDAYNGLKYALRTYSVPGVINDAPQRLSIRFTEGSARAGSEIEVLVSQPVNNATASFYSLDGRCCKSISVSGTDFTTTLPSQPGVYVLRVAEGDFAASQKLVVKG